MRNQNKKTLFYPALTLIEMVIGLAIMAIVMAALLPQLRAIENSWDSQKNSAETLQNGRFLIDHLNRNLSTAAQITAVSDSNTASGYIEFIDNDANSFRYDVNGTSNYVEFGLLGSLGDLAGPVSQLQFTCYDGSDLDTAITDVNSIRSVKVETTVVNAAALGMDMILSTQAYIRSNTLPAANLDISKLSEPWLEFDPVEGTEPALAQIDATHYLCAYAGALSDGFAVVLTVDNGNWTVTKETPLEFDTSRGNAPALSQIDQTHYLCVYTGLGVDGFAVVLTVDTGTWTITKETPLEYDTSNGEVPALCKIDNTHYLCAYGGLGSDGWATVLTVDTGTWAITNETPFEFDTATGQTPTLTKIDGTHYLCAYEGPNNDGWATVLTVDTGTWQITKETPFEFDTGTGISPALSQIDGTHYLCAYTGVNNDGWATVLTVDTGTWAITNETPFEFDTDTGLTPALTQWDSTHYLCAYDGTSDDGWAVILNVDTGTWAITTGALLEYDTDMGKVPALAQLDSAHCLCAHEGTSVDGFAGVLEISEPVLP